MRSFWMLPRRLATGLLFVGLTMSVWNSAVAQAPPPKAVTDEEARDFGTAIEAAFTKGNIGAFSALLDWDTLVDRATANVEVTDAFRGGFRNGLLKAVDNPLGFAGRIVSQSKEGVRYSMVRARVRDKQKTALFRLAPPNGAGVNYMEFLLARGKDGNVRATDVYVFFSGELLSETFHRAYVQVAAQQNRGLFDRLAGKDQEFVKSFEKLHEMSELIAAGKYKEALQVYDALPETVKKDKTFLMIRVQAAQKINEATYIKAIDDFRTLYPKDVCADILSIDGFALIKQYGKSLAAIDRLDKSVDGDGYLNVLRGGLFLMADQSENAKKAALAAVEKAPDMIDGYWTLLTVDLKMKDYPDALATLKKIDRNFELEFGDFGAIADYAGFVKSPQHNEWKDYLKTKKKPAKASP